MSRRTIDRRLAWEYLKEINNGEKTAITLAMELATRLGVTAEFDEGKDLKWQQTSFKFHARLGDIQAVGVGRSKKEAKQNSAQELINLIQSESKSSLVSNPSSPPRLEGKIEGFLSFTSPTPSLSGSISASPCEGNVIGELQNLAAKNRWKLPEYEFGEPKGEDHSRTFTCLVKMMQGLECCGVGSSKKTAKKQAAEKMLTLLQDGCDTVDAQTPFTPNSQASTSSLSNSSPELLDDSELDEYNSSSDNSSVSTPAVNLIASNDIESEETYDELAEEKLRSCSAKDGFTLEYIPLASQSKKGLYQVFLKLNFDAARSNGETQKHPIVTHGSGENLGLAKRRAAGRALTHLNLMLSVH